MNLPAALKTETEALCLAVQQLEQKLVTKTTRFDEAQRGWNSAHQPTARKLAQAMLPYVPRGDPHAVTVFEAGGWRSIASDAVMMIETPLVEQTASTHLCTVVKQLRDLANHLPTDADP